MLSPKKLIPRLAVAALPLTGTACGSDAPPSYPDDALSGAINAFCLKVAACYSGYDSNECIAYVQTYAAAVRNYGANCAEVVTSYFQCLSELSCEDYATYGPGFEACEAEINEAFPGACSN